MELLGEILLEVLMIAAVIAGVVALAYLLRLSVRERLYLRQLRREQVEHTSAVVRRAAQLRAPRAQGNGHATIVDRERRALLREHRA